LLNLEENKMPSTRLIVAAAALTLTLTACGSPIQVRTVASPDASMGNLRTFRILPVPERRGGPPPSSSDPMLVNSRVARLGSGRAAG